MLVVENLTKTYAGRSVLQNISFAIRPQSFTVVLGPSGAGKTTLMRTILQLVRLEQGRIWFGDHDLTRCSPTQLRASRAHIATVAQQFNLVRRRTALENCLGGRLSELPLWRCWLGHFPLSLQREALLALERVRLLEVAFQRADQLSGGQQQRVAIARALTQRARLLLADEPVASLDPETAHTILQLLTSLCAREGLTIVCNLHQVELARQYGDHVLGIRAGRLVLDKPTAQLTDHDIDCIYSHP
ncbi:MAG: phosphonate ABC transporter ATP-binding protein [Spirulinaceae cyanobacterium SM2_1_0]|nr:phosphonate ABC transporter ATP-binding protein [Spirulinaceae cyanobacterium SM2_1_0]